MALCAVGLIPFPIRSHACEGVSSGAKVAQHRRREAVQSLRLGNRASVNQGIGPRSDLHFARPEVQAVQADRPVGSRAGTEQCTELLS